MGLDMYIFTSKKRTLDKGYADSEEWRELPEDDSLNYEFYFWRKFNALHGWMENLYRDRGGNKEFNCDVVQLYAEDIDKLEKDMNEGNLRPVSGFFFGEQTIDEHDIELLKEFIVDARQALDDGLYLFYESWW